MIAMAGDVSISVSNPSSTRQSRSVILTFYHPQYSPITLVNDIAIVRVCFLFITLFYKH